MAVVRPFRAVTFSLDRRTRRVAPRGAPLRRHLAPSSARAILARDPHNVVALELPDGAARPGIAGQPLREPARRRGRRWRAEGVLGARRRPRGLRARAALHARRRAPSRGARFVVEVGLEPFSAGVVLPHERTLPKALGDRFDLTRATARTSARSSACLATRPA